MASGVRSLRRIVTRVLFMSELRVFELWRVRCILHQNIIETANIFKCKIETRTATPQTGISIRVKQWYAFVVCLVRDIGDVIIRERIYMH